MSQCGQVMATGKAHQEAAPFDDFLALSRRDFTHTRLVAFTGVSGSGKSSCLNHLINHHPAYAGCSVHLIKPGVEPMVLPSTDQVLCLDEIITTTEFIVLLGFLARGGRAIVASHLPMTMLQLARPFGRVCLMRTDRDGAKLGRHLAAQGISFTQAALDAFVAHHGASYTTMQLILEYSSEQNDFDRALCRFHAFCRMTQRLIPHRHR